MMRQEKFSGKWLNIQPFINLRTSNCSFFVLLMHFLKKLEVLPCQLLYLIH